MHPERMPCEHKGRDQDDVSTSQETPKIASKPPEAAGTWGRQGWGWGWEGKEQFLSKSSKETNPADTLSSDF